MTDENHNATAKTGILSRSELFLRIRTFIFDLSFRGNDLIVQPRFLTFVLLSGCIGTIISVAIDILINIANIEALTRTWGKFWFSGMAIGFLVVLFFYPPWHDRREDDDKEDHQRSPNTSLVRKFWHELSMKDRAELLSLALLTDMSDLKEKDSVEPSDSGAQSEGDDTPGRTRKGPDRFQKRANKEASPPSPKRPAADTNYQAGNINENKGRSATDSEILERRVTIETELNYRFSMFERQARHTNPKLSREEIAQQFLAILPSSRIAQHPDAAMLHHSQHPTVKLLQKFGSLPIPNKPDAQ